MTSTVEGDETAPLLHPAAPASLTAVDAEAIGHGNGISDDNEANAAICADSDAVPSMAVVFPAMALGIFLAAADGTIVLVSYAAISSELDALNLASWIVTAYVLSQASVQPLYGKLCDIFGPKQCLLAAYTLFACGCLVCGAARSIEQLIAARVLQALGGAGIGTVASILLTALVPSRDRGIWQGIVNVCYSAGAGLGLPLGGLLAGSVGWRWSFLGQVPGCALAIALVAWSLPRDIGRHKVPAPNGGQGAPTTLLAQLRRVDFLGAASLVVTIASLMLGLDRGSNVSWTAPETGAALGVSAAAALWFWYVETHVAREPIVPFGIALSPGLLPVYLFSFLAFFSMMALDYMLPLYYQAKARLTPQGASVYMLPAILAGVCMATLTGLWMKRFGTYYWALVVAALFQAVGCMLAFLLSGPLTDYMPGLVVAQVVSEIGIGNAVISGLIAVISNSSGFSVAILTATYYSVRNLGAVLGVSAASTVIQQSLRYILRKELQGYDLDVEAIVDEVRRSLDSLNDLDPDVAAIVRDCYGRATTNGFLLILGASLVAIPVVLMVRGGKKVHAEVDVEAQA